MNRVGRIGYLLSSFFVLCIIPGCSTHMPKEYTKRDGALLLGRSTDFVQHQQDFLSVERETINARRKANGRQEVKEDIIGLAMSGGGIRSNAFQLGFLSSLHDLGRIKDIDYISAVSGGSWAAGSYKSANKADNEFFEELNAIAKTENCSQDKYGTLMCTYTDALSDFKKGTTHDFIDAYVGYSGREAWRKMIVKKILSGYDVRLKDLEKNQYAAKRPYIIINATHNASYNPFKSETSRMKSNMPFEITPNHIGTYVDCGVSENYCGNWPFQEKYNGVFLTSRTFERQSLRLSHALAISGAVLPSSAFGLKLNMMEWDLDLRGNIPEGYHIREKYVLTDGGHSENLGALALIARGAKLMVVVDSGCDPHYKNGDLKVLKSHARNIFGKDVSIEDVENDYFYVGKVINKSATTETFLVYVKPNVRSKENFYDYLRENAEYADYLIPYLRSGKYDFPMDKTFALSYENDLIRSYFMFGKYIAALNAEKIFSAYEMSEGNYRKFVNNLELLFSGHESQGHPQPNPLQQSKKNEVLLVNASTASWSELAEKEKLSTNAQASSPVGLDNESITEDRKKSNQVTVLNLYDTTSPSSIATSDSFCARVDKESYTCIQESDDLFMLSPKVFFATKEWMNGELERSLQILAKGLRNSKELIEVTVNGYASENEMNCQYFINGLHPKFPNNIEVIERGQKKLTASFKDRRFAGAKVFTCEVDKTTGNEFLSALRASWVASVIESETKGAVTIQDVRGFGSDFSMSGDQPKDRSFSLKVSRRRIM